MPHESRSNRGESEGPREVAASWVRHSTIGLQFTLGIALFGGIGHWLDQRLGWDPWGVVVGLLFGFAVSVTWLYYKVYPTAPRSSGARRSARSESSEK